MNGKLKESGHNKHSVNTSPIYGANGYMPKDVVKMEDFTEMVEIQERLETALLETEKASLAKDIFLANINHELRTPMNCIMGFTELALEGDISPQTREYLNRIVENAERLLQIINSISYMSKTVTFNTMEAPNETSVKTNTSDKLEKPVFKGVVLVCEDNRINQRVIVEQLARVGLDVEIAENGLEGIEKVKRRIKKGEQPFDLILMDIHMPVMNGIEASQKIIDLGSGAPIVAMTAGTVRDKEFYKTIGMHDYVSKPFTQQELWRCLMKYLNTERFEKDQFEDAFEKSQIPFKANYAKSEETTLAAITSAIKAGDITLAHKLAHASGDTTEHIGKTTLENVPANIEEYESAHFYRAIGRITLGFLNMEQAILDALFAKATA